MRLDRAIAILMAALVSAVLVQGADAEIRFEKRTYPVQGWALPKEESTYAFNVVPFTYRGGQYLAILRERWTGYVRGNSQALIVSLSPTGGKVESLVGEWEMTPKNNRDRVYPVDFDNDGSVELFVCSTYTDINMAFELRNGRWERMDLPYPSLRRPVIAWLDYDGDGWVDLFLSGIKGASPTEQKVTQLLHNDHGTLRPTEVVFDVPEGIDSAQALDVNEDGLCDLLTYPNLTLNRLGGVVHLYVGTGTGLMEVPLPLRNWDKFIGVEMGRAALGDLDNDGRADLLIQGTRKPGTPSKSQLSVVYRRRVKDVDGMPTYAVNSDQTTQVPYVLSCSILDIDKDGDMDIIGGQAMRAGEALAYVTCLENRDGNLVLLPDLLPDSCYGEYVLPIDVDGKGLVDLLCIPGSSAKSWIVLENRSVPSTPTTGQSVEHPQSATQPSEKESAEEHLPG